MTVTILLVPIHSTFLLLGINLSWRHLPVSFAVFLLQFNGEDVFGCIYSDESFPTSLVTGDER